MAYFGLMFRLYSIIIALSTDLLSSRLLSPCDKEIGNKTCLFSRELFGVLLTFLNLRTFFGITRQDMHAVSEAKHADLHELCVSIENSNNL